MSDSLYGPEYIPSKPVKQVVIFLHGLGSNGDDLLGLAPMMATELPNTAFLAPNAPLATPFSAQGYQWFEYWDRTPLQIIDGIQNAVPLLVDYINETAERFNIGLDKIILCGFSQGTMMSLHVGLRKLEGLGGIIGFSGLLMSPESLAFDRVKKFPPILLVHGLRDTVVPAMASYQADMTLKVLGADIRYIQRPNLEHSIDQEGITEAVLFCKKIFGV